MAEFIRQESVGYDESEWSNVASDVSEAAQTHNAANDTGGDVDEAFAPPAYDNVAAQDCGYGATYAHGASTPGVDAFAQPGYDTSDASAASTYDADEAGAAPGYHANEAIPPPLPLTHDPFVLLDIDPSFAGDMGAIKSAYLRQVKAYHPDASVTNATPEDVKKRINEDFSRIHAAYEQLREGGGSVGRTALGTHRRPRPWHDQGTGYGFGQSMGAWFQSSFDPPSSAPKRAPPPPPVRNSVKSYGFVGFMSDEERPRGMHNSGKSPGFVEFTNQYHHEVTSAEVAGAAAAAQQQQARQQADAQAAAALNVSTHANSSTTAASAEDRSPVADTASNLGDLVAIEERCRSLEENLQQAEERLQRADLLAAANRRERERLEKKLQRAADEAQQQRQLHEEMLATLTAEAAKREKELRDQMLTKHLEEKKQLDEKIERLEAELKEYMRPWYQQRPRGSGW